MGNLIIQFFRKRPAIVDSPCADLFILVAKIHSSGEVDSPERLSSRFLPHVGRLSEGRKLLLCTEEEQISRWRQQMRDLTTSERWCHYGVSDRSLRLVKSKG
jgi:hypothetical protein